MLQERRNGFLLKQLRLGSQERDQTPMIPSSSS